jgi:hypothetical protein
MIRKHNIFIAAAGLALVASLAKAANIRLE